MIQEFNCKKVIRYGNDNRRFKSETEFILIEKEARRELMDIKMKYTEMVDRGEWLW